MNYSSTQPESRFDPSETLRQARDAYLEAASKIMSSMVNTASYAEVSGDLLKSYLELAEPANICMDKFMPQILAFYRMPSRNEVESAANRITNIEMKLDDISTMLEEISRSLTQVVTR